MTPPSARRFSWLRTSDHFSASRTSARRFSPNQRATAPASSFVDQPIERSESPGENHSAPGYSGNPILSRWAGKSGYSSYGPADGRPSWWVSQSCPSSATPASGLTVRSRAATRCTSMYVLSRTSGMSFAAGAGVSVNLPRIRHAGIRIAGSSSRSSAASASSVALLSRDASASSSAAATSTTSRLRRMSHSRVGVSRLAHRCSYSAAISTTPPMLPGTSPFPVCPATAAEAALTAVDGCREQPPSTHRPRKNGTPIRIVVFIIIGSLSASFRSPLGNLLRRLLARRLLQLRHPRRYRTAGGWRLGGTGAEASVLAHLAFQEVDLRLGLVPTVKS